MGQKVRPEFGQFVNLLIKKLPNHIQFRWNPMILTPMLFADFIPLGMGRLLESEFFIFLSFLLSRFLIFTTQRQNEISVPNSRSKLTWIDLWKISKMKSTEIGRERNFGISQCRTEVKCDFVNCSQAWIFHERQFTYPSLVESKWKNVIPWIVKYCFRAWIFRECEFTNTSLVKSRWKGISLKCLVLPLSMYFLERKFTDPS